MSTTKKAQGDPVSPGIIAAAVVAVVAVVGLIAWWTLGSHSSGTVHVTPDQVKQYIKDNGFGGHGAKK